MRSRIGEWLVRAGLLSDEQLRRAIAEHEKTGDRLGVVLARMRFATEEQVAEALASQLGFRYVDLRDDPPDPSAVPLLSRDLAERTMSIPTRLDGGVLTVATSDPLAFSLVPDLERQTGHRIQQVVATRRSIVAAIETYYAQPEADDRREAAARDARDDDIEDDADLLESMVARAIELDATDICIDPADGGAIVRYRVDGAFGEPDRLPRAAHDELVARIKVRAGLDVAERLLPQAGRLRIATPHGEAVFRATTLRTVDGERVVLRPLDRRRRLPGLEELGLTPAAVGELRRWIERDRGLVLVAGPARSGRTTTLYAALAAIGNGDASVVTVEDPVEARLPGVAQTQVDEALGLTFAAALRAPQIADADVVLIGDLAGEETATLAARLAQGSLVLAGIDGADAASAAFAAATLGGAAVSTTLIGVVAQRVVRRLCPACRRDDVPAPDVLSVHGAADADADAMRFFASVGCAQCSYTGFRGRVGVFELMRVTDTIRHLLTTGAECAAVRRAAESAGMTTLAEDALAKARSGVTTIDEARRVGDLVEARALCPTCGAAVEPGFLACPRCGGRLGATCASCGRALQAGWSFCPYCAKSAGNAAPSRRGIIRLVRNPDPPGIV